MSHKMEPRRQCISVPALRKFYKAPKKMPGERPFDMIYRWCKEPTSLMCIRQTYPLKQNLNWTEIYETQPHMKTAYWGNPFRISDSKKNPAHASFTEEYHTRYVIEEYEKYVRSNPDLLEQIPKELSGKVLGCSCLTHQPCHTDVLIAIWKDLQKKE